MEGDSNRENNRLSVSSRDSSRPSSAQIRSSRKRRQRCRPTFLNGALFARRPRRAFAPPMKKEPPRHSDRNKRRAKTTNAETRRRTVSEAHFCGANTCEERDTPTPTHSPVDQKNGARERVARVTCRVGARPRAPTCVGGAGSTGIKTTERTQQNKRRERSKTREKNEHQRTSEYNDIGKELMLFRGVLNRGSKHFFVKFC